MTRTLIAFLVAFCIINAIFIQTPKTFAATYPNLSKAKVSRLIDQPTITTIYRSKLGFLWIGTQQGLYRFDGAAYTFFGSGRAKNYIPASSISGIGEDSRGNLWVSTFGGGLLNLDRTSDQFITVDLGSTLEDTFLTEMVVSLNRYIWLASSKGVIAYDPILARRALWFNQHDLNIKIGKPSTIFDDRTGNIFIGSKSGLYIANPLEKTLQRISNRNLDLENTEYISVGRSDGNQIFLGTNTGKLIKYDTTAQTVVSSSKSSNRIAGTISSIEVHNEKVWIGSYNGLWFSDKELNDVSYAKSLSSLLSNQHIVTLYRNLNEIWIGTYQGLDRLSFLNFETLNTRNSNVSNDVLAFEQDSKGRLWVGTYDGLFTIEESSRLHSRVNTLKDGSSLQGQQIMALAKHQDEIWVGFRQGGLRIIDSMNLSSRIPETLNTENLAITNILHAINGKTWIGTHESGIFRINSDFRKSAAIDQYLSNQSVQILFETSNSDIIAATGNQLYIFYDHGRDFREIELIFDHPFKLHYILSINQSKNGDIWLGTKDHGLFVWTKDSQVNDLFNVKQVLPASPLSSSTIYAIEFDHKENLWLSTQRGLIQLHRDRVTLSSFKVSDGLQGSDFNFGSSFVDSSGYIYFGGVNGYNRFFPEDIALDPSPPKMLVRNINISGETVRPNYFAESQQKIQLPHNNYFISFEFSVLDFLDPGKNQYRYMLDGFDPDWVDNGNRNTATYTNLPAGTYTFRAQGANSAGVWNREGIALKVVVLPAPWLTWWAFCLYSIPLIAVFLLYRKLYGDNLLKKQAIQAAAENQMIADRAQDDLLEQQDLQDRLVQSIYQHNLTTLATVQNIMNRYFDMRDGRSEAPSRVERDLHIEALSILEGCLYHQDDCLAADLHRYTDRILAALLQHAPFPGESLITINDVTKTHIPAEFATVLAIAIMESVENSIHHAFIGRRAGHILHIELRAEPEAKAVPNFYKLAVQDNGIGLPAGFDLASVATPGFCLLSDLAASYSGRLDAVSSEGTTVTLTIPTSGAQTDGAIAR